MTPAARDRLQVRAPLLFLSGAAWLVLLNDGHHMAPETGAGAVDQALMVVAMMAPLVAPAVHHLRDRSLARRRPRALALFGVGYAAVWTVAGAGLPAVPWAARRVGVAPSFVLLAAVVVAVVWQSSPVKQRCLNRTRAHPVLAPFGVAADVAALRFGVVHAGWCVGSCWALMLLPVLLPHGQVALAVMAAVTLWLAAERWERPARPEWRLRGPGRAVRILVARGSRGRRARGDAVARVSTRAAAASYARRP